MTRGARGTVAVELLVRPPTIKVNSVDLVLPPRVWPMFAYLLLRPGVHSRDDLGQIFWPNTKDPRNNVDQAVGDIRKVLGRAALINVPRRGTTREGICINETAIPPSVVDVHWVRSGVDEGIRTGDMASIERSLVEHSGELLPGLEPSGDDRWLEEERDQHRECVDRGLDALTQHPRDMRDLGRLIARAREQVLDWPYRGRCRSLLRLLARAGDADELQRTADDLRSRARARLPAEALGEALDVINGFSPPRQRPLPPLPTPRHPTEFSGRGDLLGDLDQAWQEHHRTGPHLVVLQGEPGIGKTRVGAEFARAAHELGADVVWVRCNPGEGGYKAWLDVLTQLTRGTEDPSADEFADLRTALEGGGSLAVQTDVAQSVETRRRLFERIVFAISMEARARDLVLLIDDVHWADSATLRLLRQMCTSTEDFPLMVVVSRRDTEPAPELDDTLVEIDSKRPIQKLIVSQLAAPEIATIVSSLVEVADPDSWAEWVHEQTQGNPMFAEDLLLHLDEQGRLEGVPDAVGLDSVLEVPETIQAALEQRTRPLGDEVKLVLSIASVIGPEFDEKALAAVCELEIGELARLLSAAKAERIVVETEPGHYEFGHPLVREVLRKALTSSERLAVHTKLAEALRDYGDVDRDVTQIANHFLEAADADPDSALKYAGRAGEHAMRQTAYEDAADYFRRGAEIAAAHERAELVCSFTRQLGDAHWSLGEFQDARDCYSTAANLATPHWPEELAKAALGYGGPLSFQGVTAGKRLLELLLAARDAQRGEDTELAARVLASLAQALTFSGSVTREDAIAVAGEAVAMAERLGDDRVRAQVLTTTGWALWTPDNLEERRRIADTAVGLADQVDDARVGLEARVFRIANLLEAGEIDAATDDVSELLRRTEQLRQPFYTAEGCIVKAMKTLLNGPLEEGERLVREALDMGQREQSQMVMQVWGIQMLYIRELQGRLDEIRAASEGVTAHYPMIRAYQAGLALIYSQIGWGDDARAQFDALAENDFAAVPRDMFWLVAMDLLSRTCAVLGDAQRAAVLYRLLAPYSDRVVVSGGAAVVDGSVERNLGLLALTMSRWPDAIAHFECAIEMNQRIGAARAVAYSEYDLAETLARMPNGDRQRSLALLRGLSGPIEELDLSSLGARAHRLREAIEAGAPAPDTVPRARRPTGHRARLRFSRAGARGLGWWIRQTRNPDRFERRWGSDSRLGRLLRAMPQVYQPEFASGFEGDITFAFTREGRGARRATVTYWTVTIADGRASVTPGASVAPALELRLSATDFVRFFGGMLNPVEAWVSGDIRVSGDPGDPLVAARLIDIFGGIPPLEQRADDT